jgi:Cysteine-rich secretory protein family
MFRGFFTATALALLVTGPAATQGPQLAGATGALAAQILEAHNRERLAVGAPPLQWDAQLAVDAASDGPFLGRLGDLQHSPRESRPGQRENLAMAWHGTMTASQIVGLWAAEKKMLQPGLFPAVSQTGKWEDVAHYTQMVWPTTTRVGCAIYSTEWDYLICRYTPPGNLDGKPVFVAATKPALATATLASR